MGRTRRQLEAAMGDDRVVGYALLCCSRKSIRMHGSYCIEKRSARRTTVEATTAKVAALCSEEGRRWYGQDTLAATLVWTGQASDGQGGVDAGMDRSDTRTAGATKAGTRS